jgi:hypothetical protein
MPRSAAALLVLPLVAACRTEPRDTGCEGCFEPVQLLWNLSMGIQAGVFTEALTLDGPRGPVLELELTDEDYPTTQDAADRCTMRYRIAGTPGTLDPTAWQDWALALTPVETDCQDLPPAVWGEVPLDRFAARDWEIALEGLTDAMEKYLRDLFDLQGDDWAVAGAPHYAGSHTWIDADDTAGDAVQTHYARAWQVDAGMAVVDETEGGHLLTLEEIAAGRDGYYEVFSVYLFEL